MSKKTKDQKVYFYSEQEEKLNILSHGIGFLASLFGTFLLLRKSYPIGVPKHLISYIIYSCSLMILFGASTFYHSAKDLKLRRRLNIVDHAAIFVLIAGSYTPFAMITLG